MASLVGYVRVSAVRGREGDSFISPELQREGCQRFADAHGHTIVDWFEDLDQSGGRMDRPAFVKMMTAVDGGLCEGVIVAKLDRFARTMIGALGAIEHLNEKGAILVCVAENFDPSTPMGRAFMQISLVFAELERERIKAAWADSVGNAIARGIQPTIAPYGYLKNERRVLEPKPDEAEFVREIFSMRARRQTWVAIATHLNASGSKPRRADQWSARAAKDLVGNEVYLGVARKGKLRNETAHEPLLTKPQWLAAQDVFDKGSTPHTGDGYALTGLVRCAGCSRTMSSARYKPKGKKPVAQYQCVGHSGAGVCSARANVNEARLVPFVEAAVHAKLQNRSATVRPVKSSKNFDEAEAAVAAATEVLERYRDDQAMQDILGRARWLDGLKKLASALDAATVARDGALRAEADLPTMNLNHIWPTMSRAERLNLYGAMMDAVYVRRGHGHKIEDRARIVWKGETTHRLSGSGIAVPLREFVF